MSFASNNKDNNNTLTTETEEITTEIKAEETTPLSDLGSQETTKFSDIGLQK